MAWVSHARRHVRIKRNCLPHSFPDLDTRRTWSRGGFELPEDSRWEARFGWQWESQWWIPCPPPKFCSPFVGKDLILNVLKAFPGGSDGEESPCNAGDLGLIPGLEIFPGEGHGYLLHSSILVWEIPWTGVPGGLQSTGSQRVRPYWETNTYSLSALSLQQGHKLLEIRTGTVDTVTHIHFETLHTGDAWRCSWNSIIITIQLRNMALAAENSLSHSELVRWWQVSALLWTEGCTVTAKGTRAGIGGYLPRRMCWWRSRGEGREKEHVGSAETSKQSKPQMPPLINTWREADVYPDNLERKSQPKPERFTLHKQEISWETERQVMGSSNFSSW